MKKKYMMLTKIYPESGHYEFLKDHLPMKVEVVKMEKNAGTIYNRGYSATLNMPKGHRYGRGFSDDPFMYCLACELEPVTKGVLEWLKSLF